MNPITQGRQQKRKKNVGHEKVSSPKLPIWCCNSATNNGKKSALIRKWENNNMELKAKILGTDMILLIYYTYLMHQWYHESLYENHNVVAKKSFLQIYTCESYKITRQQYEVFAMLAN